MIDVPGQAPHGFVGYQANLHFKTLGKLPLEFIKILNSQAREARADTTDTRDELANRHIFNLRHRDGIIDSRSILLVSTEAGKG